MYESGSGHEWSQTNSYTQGITQGTSPSCFVDRHPRTYMNGWNHMRIGSIIMVGRKETRFQGGLNHPQMVYPGSLANDPTDVSSLPSTHPVTRMASASPYPFGSRDANVVHPRSRASSVHHHPHPPTIVRVRGKKLSRTACACIPLVFAVGVQENGPAPSMPGSPLPSPRSRIVLGHGTRASRCTSVWAGRGRSERVHPEPVQMTVGWGCNEKIMITMSVQYRRSRQGKCGRRSSVHYRRRAVELAGTRGRISRICGLWRRTSSSLEESLEHTDESPSL